MHVEMDFVSPENLRECVRLSEEVRLLPEHHHAKEDKLEVYCPFIRTLCLAVVR